MTSIKFYFGVYVVLMVLAVSKVVFMETLDYWPAVGGIFAMAVAKSALIAYYYQHLKEEPRAITWLVLIAVAAVLFLAVAATFSIT